MHTIRLLDEHLRHSPILGRRSTVTLLVRNNLSDQVMLHVYVQRSQGSLCILHRSIPLGSSTNDLRHNWQGVAFNNGDNIYVIDQLHRLIGCWNILPKVTHYASRRMIFNIHDVRFFWKSIRCYLRHGMRKTEKSTRHAVSRENAKSSQVQVPEFRPNTSGTQNNNAEIISPGTEVHDGS